MIFGFTYAFFASQIFAGIAMIFDICSFQFKERKKIILFFILAASAIGLHYLLLDRYVGAAIVAIGIVRFITSYFRTEKFWIFLFVGCYVIATIVLYKDIYDLVLLFGMTLSTISVFQKDDKKLRLIMMSGTSLIILYNFFIISPVGMLMEGVFLGSNVVGYYRHYLAKNKLGKKH